MSLTRSAVAAVAILVATSLGWLIAVSDGHAQLTQQIELSAAGNANELAGSSVGVGGDVVVVGAPYASSGGEALVYVQPGAGWAAASAPTAVLTAPGAGELGASVAVDAAGTTIAVGDPDTNSVDVYSVAGIASWKTIGTPTAVLSANDLKANPLDDLGASVAIDTAGDTIVAGDPDHKLTYSNQGASFVFVRPAAGHWASTGNQTGELTAKNGAEYDLDGSSVAVSGDGLTIVTGAPSSHTGCLCTSPGAAYVFTQPKPSTGWSNGASDINQTATLSASAGVAGDQFGSSVAIDGNGGTVAVGANFHEVSSTVDEGAAYVFVRPGTGPWATAKQNVELTEQSGHTDDELGSAITITGDGDTVLAGADGLLGSSLPPGTADVFAAPSGAWPAAAGASVVQNSETLTAADGSDGDAFGYSLALSGGTVAVGAPYRTVDGQASHGVAYVFGPPPAITITAPANGATYRQGAIVDAAFGCTVTLATISSCAGPVADGAAIDTATTGQHSFTVSATTSSGTTGSATVTYTVQSASPPARAPSLSNVKQSHTRWREGTALAKLAARGKAGTPTGTAFSFKVSERAQITFSFAPKGRGTKAAGKLRFTAGKGSHKLSFDGRLSRHVRLSAGSYTVTITASATGQSSKAKKLSFTIVRARG